MYSMCEAISLKYPELVYAGEGKGDFFTCNEGVPGIEIFEWYTDKYPKPTDEEMQQWYKDLRYKIDRVRGTPEQPLKYASREEVEDMKYWDAINGTTTWSDHIAEVKATHPKPEA